MDCIEAMKTPLRRLPGATGDHPAITDFVDEVRAYAVTRPKINADHIAWLETSLANAHHAAADDPALLDLWDMLVAEITAPGKSVNERLEGIGKAADAWNEKRRGKVN